MGRPASWLDHCSSRSNLSDQKSIARTIHSQEGAPLSSLASSYSRQCPPSYRHQYEVLSNILCRASSKNLCISQHGIRWFSTSDYFEVWWHGVKEKSSNECLSGYFHYMEVMVVSSKLSRCRCHRRCRGKPLLKKTIKLHEKYTYYFCRTFSCKSWSSR